MNGARNPLLSLSPEYDIREIPEDLYEAVLASRSAGIGCGAMALARCNDAAEPTATD